MNITNNGIFSLTPKRRLPSTPKSVIKVHGDLGAASAKLVYKGSDDNFHDYDDGALSSGDQLEITHGLSSEPHVEVTGADGATNFYVEVNYTS